MQSGFRGYLLTGQKSFLQPFYEGINEVPPLLAEQRRLISSTLQKKRLDSIIYLHESWLRYTDSLISTRQDTSAAANERYRKLFETKLKMEVGKKLNDSIKQKFIPFDSYEYDLRQTRRVALQKSILRTRNMSIALTITSVTLALITSIYIVQIITRRIAKMVNLAGAISNGDFIKIEDKEKDELKKLSESLNSMSETLDKNFQELTKKNKELDQFAYVVSHDLKAPLRGIDNIAKWTIEDHDVELSPAVKKNIELIQGRTVRLENMINGLLEYARIGRIKKGQQKVDVNVLLNELVEVLVPPSFNIKIDPDMPVFTTEKLRLEQVFSNLISNAVKYNDKDKGEIGIHFRELSDVYEFVVTDNGPGIHPDYHEKIFMIFQTLQERDAFESTGVGLAIVKKIIEEQKGSISVESDTGEGSAFKFTWRKFLD